MLPSFPPTTFFFLIKVITFSFHHRQLLSQLSQADIIPVFVSPCSLLCVDVHLVLGLKYLTLEAQGKTEKPSEWVIFQWSLTSKSLSSWGPKSREDLKYKSDHIPLAQLSLFQFNIPNWFPFRAFSFTVSAGWNALSPVLPMAVFLLFKTQFQCSILMERPPILTPSTTASFPSYSIIIRCSAFFTALIPLKSLFACLLSVLSTRMCI